MSKYFTEDQLASFLDGEADPLLAESIRGKMEKSDELRAEVQSISDTINAIKTAFDAQEDDTPPFHLPEKAQAQGFPNILVFAYRPAYAASFVSFCLMIAATFAFWPLGSSSNDFGHGFAQAHQEQGYLKSDIWNVGLESDREKFSRLSYFSSHVGLDLTRFMGSRDVHFVWARFLNVNDETAIQLSFISNEGEEISLYLLRNTFDFTESPDSDVTDGLTVSRWKMDDVGIVLVQGAGNGSDVDASVRNNLIQSFADTLIVSKTPGAPRTMI